MCIPQPPKPPKIVLPPPPPPPAMRDEPEVDAAEFEMNKGPDTATKTRKKYRKKSKGSSKTKGNKEYTVNNKGGGLNAM
jgi:hypothetical protein